MQRATLLLSTVVVLGAGCSDAPAAPRLDVQRPLLNAVTSTEIIPIEEDFVAPSGPCTSEAIHFTLREQLVLHETDDAAGGVHLVFVNNDKGSTGLGLTSGTTYHQTGATVESAHITDSFPFVDTFVFVLNIVAPGRAPNFRLHVNLHVTVNANGVLTALVDNVTNECQ
jgi:hypothetical protein